MRDEADLLACIAQAGLNPPDDIRADGVLHRFSSNGRAGDDAGWYVCHQAFVGRTVRYYGAFGDWRTGLTATWVSAGNDLTFAEREALRAMVAEQQRARWAERHNRDQRGKVAAMERLVRSVPVDPSHPYLVAKHLPADHRIRQLGDDLLVPMYDLAEEMWNLQTIKPDGSKRYGPGRASGLMLPLGDNGADIAICEGYATGRSLELAGVASRVVVAFSAGQLEPVAAAVRERNPIARLMIVADNDCFTDGNPGVTAAWRAARAAGGVVMVPDDDRPDSVDFNDLWVTHGADAVKYLGEQK